MQYFWSKENNFFKIIILKIYKAYDIIIFGRKVGFMELRIIAKIHTDFKEKFGIPRQSGRAPSLTATIVFTPAYRSDEALKRIEEFSHLWLIFGFSKAKREPFSPTVRPPRLGGNVRVGVFASRSPYRPNGLGLSSVKLVSVNKTLEGTTLTVSGADLLDGTPIYDIKPYLPFADSHPDAIGGYADEKATYKLEVIIPEILKNIIDKDKLNALIECLADDPRPSYQEDGREYGMNFSNFEIKFTVIDKTLTVKSIIKSN
jgi:tRNA-Thr(GGU) m(6)t(6)A37 methyltransferase TsaA